MIATVKQSDSNHLAGPDGPLLFSAQPNAGLPQRIDNRFFYVATPDYVAEYAVRFAEAGVHLIGGCCGTTPRHIEAMRKALDEHSGVSTPFFPGAVPPTSMPTPLGGVADRQASA